MVRYYMYIKAISVFARLQINTHHCT